MSDIEANEKAETAEVSTDAEARPNARKVRDGLVVSVSMNKTVVIANVRWGVANKSYLAPTP